MLALVSAIAPILLVCLTIWSWSAMRLYAWLTSSDVRTQVATYTDPASARFGAGGSAKDFAAAALAFRADANPRVSQPDVSTLPPAPEQIAHVNPPEQEPPEVMRAALIAAELANPRYPMNPPAIVQPAAFAPGGHSFRPFGLQEPLGLDEPPSVAGPSSIALAIFAPSALDPDKVRGVLTDIRAAGVDSPEARPVGLQISSTQVRYYHEADKMAAERVATAAGAELRDFTSYSPEPPSGTVELWLAGKPQGTRTASSRSRAAESGDIVLTRLIRSFWPLTNNQTVRVAVTRASRQGGDAPAWSRGHYEPQTPSIGDNSGGRQGGGASGRGASGASGGGTSGSASSDGGSSNNSGGGYAGGSSGPGSSAGDYGSSNGQRDKGKSDRGRGNSGNGKSGKGDRGKSGDRGGGKGGRGGGKGRG